MEDLGTTNGMMIAAITTLSGVVTFLWKQVSDNHKAVYAKLTDCEDDREELWKMMHAIHPASKSQGE